MSLVDISHPDGRQLDELVPSRYALRVGDIDVLVISDGVLPITAVTVATNAAPADLSAWLKDMYLPPEVLDWPLNVAVVRSGGQTVLIDSGLGTEFPDFPRAGQLAMRLQAAGISLILGDRRSAHPLAYGSHRRPAGRRAAKPAAAGPASPPGRGRSRVLEAPDFSRTVMPSPIPDVLRRTATQFLDVYRGQLRTFETEYEVAPGVTMVRTGGHTPGHSIVRIESGGEALTFAGDAVFQPGFDNPEWQNGFEHDPEESARVRIRLLTELAASGEQLVATHLPFPSVCHVAVTSDGFRMVPAVWDY